MALSKDDIINALESMTVVELFDLVKAIEEKFGVKAAAAEIGRASCRERV